MKQLFRLITILLIVFLLYKILATYEPQSTVPNDNAPQQEKEQLEEKILPPPPLLPTFTFSTRQSILEEIWEDLFPSSYPYAKDLMRAARYDDSFILKVRNQIADPNLGPANLGQICDIFDFLYLNKKVTSDPIGEEYFVKPEDYWTYHTGDCDDMAICSSVACNIIGGFTRIILAYEEEGHAYAELCLGNQDVHSYSQYLKKRYPGTSPKFYKDTRGFFWLNLDLNNPNPGGSYFKGKTHYYYYPSLEKWFDLFKDLN